MDNDYPSVIQIVDKVPVLVLRESNDKSGKTDTVYTITHENDKTDIIQTIWGW